MGCCLAIALIVAVARAVWFRLVPSRAPVRAAFAPPARRAAPGATAPVLPREHPAGDRADDRADAPAVPAPTGGAGPSRADAAASLLVGAAAGVALYAAVSAALLGLGLVMSMASTGEWLARDGALAVAVAAALACALVLRRRAPAGPAPEGRPPVARLLVGAGAAWTVATVVDMHVTGALMADHTDAVAVAVLHGPGLVALVLGAAALAPRLARPITRGAR